MSLTKDDLILAIKTAQENRTRSGLSSIDFNWNSIAQAILVTGIIGLYIKLDNSKQNDTVQNVAIEQINTSISEIKKDVKELNQEFTTLVPIANQVNAQLIVTSGLADKIDDLEDKNQALELEVNLLKSKSIN